MRQIFFLFLFLLATMTVTGQTQNVDSLINVLETQKITDDKKIELYFDIGNIYKENNYDKCIEYSNKGLLLAEKNNNEKQIAAFYNQLGVSYINKGSFDTSYIYMNKYLEIAVKLKDKDLEMRAYGNIGNIYIGKKDYQTAIEYYLKSLAVSDTLCRIRANNLLNLSSAHRTMHQLDKAEQYIREALDIAKKINYNDIEMGANHTLGTIYSDKQQYDKSMEYFKKALALSKILNNKQYEILSSQSLAGSYAQIGNYSEAIRYGKEALHIANELGTFSFFVSSHLIMSEIYRQAERYKESEEMALKAWVIDSTSINNGSFAAFNLAIDNIYLENKQQAEYFVSQFQDILFKGNDKQMSESIANMETKYETEKKDLQITSFQKERRMYIWIGIACALLIVSLGVVLWLTLRNARKERQLVAAKAVQDGELNERARLAEDLHDRLGGSLSAVKMGLRSVESLQNVSDKLDQCIKEVREITHDLMPRSLRLFGLKGALEDFCAQFTNVRFHSFGKANRMKGRLEFAVYCCASELVTNSLRYSGAENINVQLIQDEKYVSLTVQDDGCGFDEKAVIPGIGLKNIRDRVASYSGKLDIASAPGKGTETVIELKVES